MSPKGPRCKKVNNACKICLEACNPKNAVQCLGACQTWVHFKCLDYTPGKIMDIKAGAIVVTCPCPDCKSTVPKEYKKDPPYACNNLLCPANNPPSCDDTDCPANEVLRCRPPRCPPPGTLRTCGSNLCRDFSTVPNVFPSTRDDPCMEGYPLKTYCPKPGHVPVTCGAGVQLPGPRGNLKQGQGALPTTACNRQPVQGNNDNSGMPELINTVAGLSQQLNMIMQQLKEGKGGGNHCGNDGAACEGNAPCKKCATQGEGRKKCTGGCGQKGKAGCSQPCRCPGNPIQKNC